jgi:hypothetical protein
MDMLNAIPERVLGCFDKTRKPQPSNSVNEISILKKDSSHLLYRQMGLRHDSKTNDTS